jgi:hypothetical protein
VNLFKQSLLDRPALGYNIVVLRRSFGIRLRREASRQRRIRSRFWSRRINVKQEAALPAEFVFGGLLQIDQQVETIRNLLRLRGSALRGLSI